MSNFPGSLDSDASLYVSKDFISTKLISPQAIGDNVAVVASGSGWAINMVASIEFEQQLVTGVAGNVLTVTRAFGGTTAVAHGNGKAVSNNVDAIYQSSLKSAVIAIETALGSNLSNIATSPVTNSAPYNFAALTPGGSLGVGANTITLTPMPAGINSTFANVGFLYISGGTGTAEAVPVIGVSATTVTVTCANTHSGAWTIKSATGGIQEAICFASPVGRVQMPGSSQVLLYGPINIPANSRISLRGAGMGHTYLSTVGLTGNWISIPQGSSGWVDIGDFTIDDSTNTVHSSGVMLTIARTYGIVSNLQISHAYDGIECDGCAGDINFIANNVNSAHYGLRFTSGTTQATILGGVYGGTVSGLRVDATTVVGLYVVGVLISVQNGGVASSSAVSLRMGVGLPINETVFIGCDFEGGSAGGNAFEVIGTGTYQNNSIHVTGSRINQLGVGSAVFAQLAVNGLIVANNNITATSSSTSGVLLSDVRNSIVSGNKFVTDATVSYGINLGGTTGQHIQILNNQIGYESAAPANAIALTTASDVQISGNNLAASGTVITGASGVTGLSIVNNVGIDNVIPAVASAATLAFPLNPNFTVTGANNISAVTQALIAGSCGTLVSTSGNLFATAGASIGNSFIFRQNVPCSWVWDGTKMWFVGQDPGISNSYNYIATENGANNAIAGTLAGATLGAGLQVTVKLAHTLQAGANTFAFNGGGAVAIKSAKNVANNIATAWAATGSIVLLYDGTQWVDCSQ